jgi:hypothetical protein
MVDSASRFAPTGPDPHFRIQSIIHHYRQLYEEVVCESLYSVYTDRRGLQAFNAKPYATARFIPNFLAVKTVQVFIAELVQFDKIVRGYVYAVDTQRVSFVRRNCIPHRNLRASVSGH